MRRRRCVVVILPLSTVPVVGGKENGRSGARRRRGSGRRRRGGGRRWGRHGRPGQGRWFSIVVDRNTSRTDAVPAQDAFVVLVKGGRHGEGGGSQRREGERACGSRSSGGRCRPHGHVVFDTTTTRAATGAGSILPQRRRRRRRFHGAAATSTAGVGTSSASAMAAAMMRRRGGLVIVALILVQGGGVVALHVHQHCCGRGAGRIGEVVGHFRSAQEVETEEVVEESKP